jgi:hypothetical protein
MRDGNHNDNKDLALREFTLSLDTLFFLFPGERPIRKFCRLKEWTALQNLL